ncbi:MAG: PKD domain-containing protein, partial [Flavobacteriales bacterium]|nr:PKD domain-containing protein [Flavobacteriales bacterium]
MLFRFAFLCSLLAIPCLGWTQGGWCNNNFDIPDGIELCPNGATSLDWWDWYDDGNNDPDLLEALWISPSGDTTALAQDEPFVLDGSMESGTWTVFFDLTDPGPRPDDCTFELDFELLATANADFTVLQDGICGSEGIEFDLTPSSGVDYSWNFGDGNGSTLAQPTHQYSLDGGGTQNVTVTLTTETSDGCTASTSQTISVLQEPNPGISDFAPLCLNNPSWPNYELIPTPLPFGSDGITSWSVDWGNGSDTSFTDYDIFTGGLITQYDNYGYYTITVDVEGANGCTTQIVDSVFVGNNPQIGSANPGNTDGLCSPFLLEFPITNYEDNADGTTYNLDFGDGGIESLTHVDLNEVPPTIVGHEYTVSSCGETTPEGSQNAYRFRIEAVNECGTSVTTVDPIRIHQGPDPQIGGPDGVCAGVPFEYSVTGAGEVVTESTCTATNSLWNITPLDGQSPVTTSQGVGTSWTTSFPEPGAYSVTALDIHPNCPNGNDEMIVCVYPPMEAIGTALPTNGCAPLMVNVQDLSPMPEFCGVPQSTWFVEGGPYNWVNGGPDTDDGILELTAAGTYTLRLRVEIPDKGSCPADEQVFTVEVFEPPTVTVGSLTMVCAGESLDMMISSLDDGGTAISDWSWQLDGVEFSDVQGTVPLTLTNPGEFVVTGEATNLCGSDTSNIYIDVDSIPEIDFELPVLPAFCAGDTLLVIATGAETYTWSSSPVIVGDLHSHCVPIVPQSNVSLGLSANSANGCTNTATIDLDIAPLPEVSIVPPAPPCPDITVSFSGSATGGSGTFDPFQWSGSQGTGSGSTYDWTAPPSAGIVEVTLTVTDDVGCDNTTTVSLTSFDNPVVEAGDTLVLCNNDAVVEPLTGYSPGLTEGGGSGSWSGPGLTGADSFSPNGVGVYDLTYSYIDANGCSENDMRTVVVEDLTQVDPGSPVEACFGDAALTMNDWMPLSATWSGVGVTSDGTLDPSITPGTYTLTIDNGSGSCYTTDNKTFTVHPLPSPEIIGDTEVCQGDTAQLFLSEPDGASLTWDFNAGTPAQFDTVAGTVNMAFEATAFSAQGCAETVQWTVDVNLLPLVEAPMQEAFCNQNIPANLTGATPAGGSWSGPGVTDPMGTFLPSAAGTGPTDLLYTYQDSN